MMMATQIERLSTQITCLMPVLLDAAAKGTILLAVAWLIIPPMRLRSAASRHMAWFACLAGLLVLPLLGRALPAWRVVPGSWDLRQAVVSVQPVEPAPVSLGRQPISPAPAPRVDRVSDVPKVAPAALPAAAPVPHTVRPIPVSGWIGIAWLTGTVLLLLRLLAGMISLLWASCRLPLCRDEQWQAALQQTCDDLGIRRRVRLLQGHGQAMPMTWGILRPHLLVPSDRGSWSPQRRRVVLLHEPAWRVRVRVYVRGLAGLAAQRAAQRAG